MQIPTADGTTIWADTVGTGEPVVLLSGMSQDHRAWSANMELAKSFRVVLIDNRGTGRSGDWLPDDEPTTGQMADDVLAVLNHLEIQRAHIVGHSMGGRIAQWVAVRFPKRVGALVLLASSCGERKGIARTDEVDRVLLGGDPVELALLNYNRGWLGKNRGMVGAINASLAERSSQRQAHHQATHGHDSFSSLSRIKAPTLLIHGTDDLINPVGNLEILAEQIPHTESMIIEGGRHNVGVEYAAQVDARIIEFLHAHPLED